MNAMAWTYLVYLLTTIAITVWVARTLRRYGVVLMNRSATVEQRQMPELTDALSHLLIVGFYLICLGVISFALRSSQRAVNVQESIELLSGKVGMILVILGAMHFLMLAVCAGFGNPAQPVTTYGRHSVSELGSRGFATRGDGVEET